MGFVTPDYGTLFWMLIIFGIVLFILKKFAWKPILSALKDRENSIANALSSADRAREEVKDLKADHEKIIAEARREKDIILKEAKEVKDELLAEAKEQAASEGQKIVEAARQKIETEKTAAISEMKKQIVDLSVLVAEKIIQKELKNKDTQEGMVEDLLKDLKLK
ncbi:F0F1 ATP synthase subunit B [uncultured Sunxiuqinia sp.]|uniref:F0F1 ATP synthase subunit B n=1 Tax=uncultured Sunxiuqinia sp. TaxID=1573825 RepID=UPI002AA61983|nr:F0F1 ATP synthase subunit B [uncultured Sunxiuqinia sp.]